MKTKIILVLLAASLENVAGADGGWMDHLFGWLLSGIGDDDPKASNLRTPQPTTEEEAGEMFERLLELGGIPTSSSITTTNEQTGERMFSLLNWGSSKQEGKRAMGCLAYLGGFPEGEDGAPKIPFMEGLYYRVGFLMFADNPDNVDYICEVAQDYKKYGLLPEVTKKGQLRFFPTKDQQRERRERMLQRERQDHEHSRRRLGTPTTVDLSTGVLNPDWERVGANVRLQNLLEGGRDYGQPTKIERMVDFVYFPQFTLENLQLAQTVEIMDAVCSGLSALQFGFDPGSVCAVIPGIIRSVITSGDYALNNIQTMERVAIIHDRLITQANDVASRTDVQNLVTTLLP